MNPLDLLEKFINERGSAKILLEHLSLVRSQLAEAERLRGQAETKSQLLQAQLQQAQLELADARAQLAQKSGLISAELCAHCGGAQLRRTGTRPHPMFGEVGLREAVLQCEVCKGTTYVELPLN